MTAEKTQKKSQAEEENKQAILKISEAWKKMYFESESALARSIDEYVAGQSFTDSLEQMGSQYLSMYKAANQNMDRFFANHPMPTKKDIARVCELVIAVEEKVDHLEGDLSANMAGLASSLIKLVDFQVVLKEEIMAIRGEVQSMQEQLLQMRENKAGLTAQSLTVDKPADQSAGEVASNLAQEENKQTPPITPPRPRSRTKPTQAKK